MVLAFVAGLTEVAPATAAVRTVPKAASVRVGALTLKHCDVLPRALRSMISWMTLRGSAAGSYCAAIDHRLWPGSTTTARRLW